MRISASSLVLVAAFSAVIPAAWAQARTTSPSGFGRVMFPGGGGPGTTPVGTGAPSTGFGRVIFPGTAAPAVARPGMNPVNQPPPVQHPGHGQQVFVPYPVFFGGGYYDAPAPLFEGDNRPRGQLFATDNLHSSPSTIAAQAQNQAYANQLPDQTPVVILNQYFTPDQAPPQTTPQRPAATSTVEPRPAPQLVDQAPDPIIYLIAMKDHSIYAASSYFLDGDTLNYKTVHGTENSVSLELVDRELSRVLNRNRSVAFAMPRE